MTTTKEKRLAWTVAHTANSDIEETVEEMVKDFLAKNWTEMLGQTEVEFDQKDARKIIKSWKSCEVMLVWSEDETGL